MESAIDAKGKACPIPVIMAKKETERGSKEFSMSVDNKTAVENLTRFAQNQGYSITTVEKSNEEFLLKFSKQSGNTIEVKDKEVTRMGKESKDSLAVFINSNGIGQGDPEFSATLLKMYLFTVSESKDLPAYILFMNEGVRVVVENEQAIDHLKAIAARGTGILVCGTCLNFYNIAESIKVGTVSNMYDIVEAMQSVDKVITL
jgi:selenium metabolism protein YedF